MAYKILRTIQVKVYACRCERCTYEWETQGDIPEVCAKCKNRYWNTPRGTVPRGRPAAKPKQGRRRWA